MDKFITPCIIQTLIIAICITVIIITYLRRQQVKPDSCKVCIDGNGEKRRKLHLIYMSSIASGIIILLYTYITVNSTDYNNINSYFTFASTIVSIVLAIVTIVYSISTSEATTNSIGSIEKTTDTVNKAAQDVRDASLSYSKSAASLDKHIDDIIDAIKRIEHHTATTAATLLNANKINDEKDLDAEKLIFGDFIERYLTRGSVNGGAALYACFKSYKKHNIFHLDILSDDKEQQKYLVGYIISSAAIGLINVNIDRDYNIEVISVLPGFEEKILAWIKEPKYGDLQANLDLDIVKINNYFS